MIDRRSKRSVSIERHVNRALVGVGAEDDSSLPPPSFEGALISGASMLLAGVGVAFLLGGIGAGIGIGYPLAGAAAVGVGAYGAWKHRESVPLGAMMALGVPAVLLVGAGIGERIEMGPSYT